MLARSGPELSIRFALLVAAAIALATLPPRPFRREAMDFVREMCLGRPAPEPRAAATGGDRADGGSPNSETDQ